MGGALSREGLELFMVLGMSHDWQWQQISSWMMMGQTM